MPKSLKDNVQNALQSALTRKLMKEGPKLMTDMSAFNTLSSRGIFDSTPNPSEVGPGGASTTTGGPVSEKQKVKKNERKNS